MNRLILLAAAGLTLGSVPAMAQSKADDPTPPPPSGTSVTVGNNTFNLDPACPLPAVLLDRRQVLNTDTIDTLQPFFRTTSGFVPGLSYQTLDVGLEKVAVGQTVCVGKSS